MKAKSVASKSKPKPDRRAVWVVEELLKSGSWKPLFGHSYKVAQAEKFRLEAIRPTATFRATRYIPAPQKKRP